MWRMRLRLFHHPFLWSLLVFLLLAACGGGSGGDAVDAGQRISPITGGDSQPRVRVDQARAGTSYNVTLRVEATGDEIALTVFEPDQLRPGESYPLVLHSHGYGGSRNQAGDPSAFQQRLTDAGYYVISFDQRGFGDSTGTVRIQSPDFEGQDLIAILNWAESLPGLARRANGKMLVGSYGGSYGGMYQVLLAAVDPKQRLRVIAPDITPNNLVYSLYPHGVIKSGWALALAAGGELPLIGLVTGSSGPEAILDRVLGILEHPQRPLRQDPAIYEILLTGALTNQIPKAGRHFLAYHSFSYFCEDVPAQPQPFDIATPDPRNVPPKDPPAINALLTQGFRDTLFNFNEAYRNYQCLQKAGGDVRLLTHQSGHILPLSVEGTPIEQALAQFEQALHVPEFQSAGGSRMCGSLNLDDVTFAWFQAKLKGKEAALEAALPIGDEICLSLAEGDAVTVNQVTVGGRMVKLKEQSTTALNGVFGIVGSLLGTVPSEQLLADQTLLTIDNSGRVIAGIPTLELTIAPPLGTASDCAVDVLPLGCDPILFIGLGIKSPGDNGWELIDDQLTPLRGYGTHKVHMVGIAERLHQGDQIGLLVYGFHPQYLVTWSRDLLVPAVTISGNVHLPILGPTEIVRSGI